MTATETRSSVTPNRVDFVDKDNARSSLFALHEKVSNTGSSDTDEHFYKIGTADTEERYPGFTRNGTSKKGLAGSRRPHKQTSFGNSAAKLRKFFRIF